MPKPELQFAIPSMSVGEYRPTPMRISQIVVPPVATVSMINRFKALERKLAPRLGEGNVSLSLHLGFATDVVWAAIKAARNGVNVSSLDIADVYTAGSFIPDFLDKIVAGNKRQALLTGGRKIQNVGSVEDRNKKLTDGISAFSTKALLVLRTHSGLWVEGNMGDDLRRFLDPYKERVVLAVEILGPVQSVPEYRDLIIKLSKTNGSMVPVLFDLDLAHIEEAGYDHQHRSQRKKALEVYREILSNPEENRLVASTSLNQYIDGSVDTHASLSDGPIDLLEAVRLLSRASKDKRMIADSDVVIPEFYPSDYDDYSTGKEADFLASAKVTYDSNLPEPKEEVVFDRSSATSSEDSLLESAAS